MQLKIQCKVDSRQGSDYCDPGCRIFPTYCSSGLAALSKGQIPLCSQIVAENESTFHFFLVQSESVFPLTTKQILGKGVLGFTLFSITVVRNQSNRRFVVVLVQSLSHVRLFATPWNAACQASLSFTISQEFAQMHVH